MKSAWTLGIAAMLFCLSASAAPESRIRLSRSVRALVNADTPDGQLARTWLRYVQGLIGEAGVQLDDVAAPDVRCAELDVAGYPPGIAGLKQFRHEINVAVPDESTFVARMTIQGPGIVETELHVTGTNLGPLMGHAPTGRSMRVVIHTLGRFKDGRLVERWDRTDFADMLRQLGISQ
jgi:predicted ester cyclase